MFKLASLLACLLTTSVLANFDGQVVSVQSFLDMDHSLLSFGGAPSDFTVNGGSSNATSPDGHITANSTEPVVIQSNSPYTVPLDGEMHFQYVLSFVGTSLSSAPGPLGTIEDPLYGCFVAGPTDLMYTHFQFVVTNTKVYALVIYPNSDGMTVNVYGIPIGNRSSSDYNTYTVIIKGNEGSVLFRIDNVDKLEVPGYCGIDSKFQLAQVNITAPTIKACVPEINSASLPTVYYNYLSVGTFLGGPLDRGFCQRTTFNTCAENISYARGARCQYASPPGPFSFAYQAHLASLQVFTMQDTNRCARLDDSSSSYHNWWSRPAGPFNVRGKTAQ